MNKRTIRHYLILSFFQKAGFAFTAAMYVTFLLSKGLDLYQVNLVNLVFYVTLFLAEIPTGAIADIFGRRLSFFLACLLEGVGMFVYGLSDSFLGFAAAEAIIAIGATCASGAFQAWLVDRLDYYGYEGKKDKIFARENQVDYASSILAGLAGAIIAGFNQRYSWFAGGASLLLGAVLTLVWVREEYFESKRYSIKEGFAQLVETSSKSIKYATKQRSVRFILLIGVVQYFAVQALNMQWQPRFTGLVHSSTGLGFLWAAMSLALMAGAGYASRFLGYIKSEKKALAWSQLAIALGILFAGMIRPSYLGAAFFLLHEGVRGLWRPVKDAYLHDNIPSKERATIVSCESIMHHIGGALGLIVSGFLAQRYSISVSWVVSGAVLLFGTLAVAKNSKK